MRTSSARADIARSNRRQSIIAVALATVTVAVTATTVALQDVVELAGVETQDETRWTAHMVAVPTGSTHVKTSLGSIGHSPSSITRHVAIDIDDELTFLDTTIDRRSGKTQVINRSRKGDRAYIAPKKELLAASTNQKLLWPESYVGETAAASNVRGNAGDLIDVARLFLPRDEPKAFSSTSEDLSPSVLFAQMSKHADATLTVGSVSNNPNEPTVLAMNASYEEVKTADSLSLATAYSAPETDDASASAFAAVLRPALKPEDPIKLTVPTKRPKHKPQVRISLSKGDHKWALNPLPRKSWSKSQRRCLAAGIYFEARGEPVKGQQAVAQVILNRVKNPAYPNSICGVVYQNKRMRNRCQFSFACDGIRDRVKSNQHWTVAKKVADDSLEGRVWLRAVGSASHYHADYVRPRWRRSMKRMTKIGRHIFYRTIRGGWS